MAGIPLGQRTSDERSCRAKDAGRQDDPPLVVRQSLDVARNRSLDNLVVRQIEHEAIRMASCLPDLGGRAFSVVCSRQTHDANTRVSQIERNRSPDATPGPCYDDGIRT